MSRKHQGGWTVVHPPSVRTTFLPDDETCFHVFEAPSSEVVTQVATRAGLGRTWVIEIVDASDPNGESRT